MTAASGAHGGELIFVVLLGFFIRLEVAADWGLLLISLLVQAAADWEFWVWRRVPIRSTRPMCWRLIVCKTYTKPNVGALSLYGAIEGEQSLSKDEEFNLMNEEDVVIAAPMECDLLVLLILHFSYLLVKLEYGDAIKAYRLIPPLHIILIIFCQIHIVICLDVQEYCVICKFMAYVFIIH
ncbi:uncharacterized protein G2W53_007184 [Senna tora]|uniref:Uncharacterized protein n=1 Tax=Senna tora TaxID=362788 RepID=A0A834X5M8_9FABA|nr:uncharacterized protein G2W53_007184 [Senna tora]